MCVFVHVLIFRLISVVIQEERWITAEQYDHRTTIIARAMVVIVRDDHTDVTLQVLDFIFVVNVVLELYFDHILIIVTFGDVKCSKSVLFQRDTFLRVPWLYQCRSNCLK